MKKAVENEKQTKIPMILIGIVIALLSFSVIAIFIMKMNLPNPRYVCIYQDTRLIYKIDLSQVKESYTISIEGEDGCVNIVEIRPDSVGIVDASCPDKLCVNMGFIKDNLIPITCLPNHLVIKLEGGKDNETQEIDGIVW